MQEFVFASFSSVQFIYLFIFFICLPNVHNKLVTENKKTLINNN